MAFGKITPKQQEILNYIKDEILKKGYPPTVREICETSGSVFSQRFPVPSVIL